MDFKFENKKFLELCPSREAEIQYYTHQVEDIFRTIGIENDYSTQGVRANVEEWYDNKSALFEVLRKHECWNEEAKAVIFLHDEERIPDGNNFRIEVYNLHQYVERKIESSGHKVDLFFGTTLRLLAGHSQKEISSEEAEAINNFGYYREVKPGTKRSRVLNALFKEVPVDGDKKIDATAFADDHEDENRSFDSYNKIFARAADAVNPLKIKRITVLSVNICDYLLASNGNSWSSCHFINANGAYRGCYKAGTLSYANDKTSMVFYTVSSEYSGSSWRLEPKITRQMFHYQNGNLLQSRLYPKGWEAANENYSDYREVVQKIMSDCLGVPNLWKKLLLGDWSEIYTYDDSLHYRDYEEYPKECVMSYNKEFENQTHLGIEIGGRSYCVDCGAERYADDSDENKSLQCYDCREREVYCTHCGVVYNVDDIHEIDGGYYCESCCFYCDYHNEWEPRYDGRNDDCRRYISVSGEVLTMCCDAVDSEYIQCDYCGEYIPLGEYTVLDNHGILCEDCYNEYIREENENENE